MKGEKKEKRKKGKKKKKENGREKKMTSAGFEPCLLGTSALDLTGTPASLGQMAFSKYPFCR